MAAKQSPDGHEKTILIAEDEEFLSKLLSLSLRRRNFRVLTVQNGNEAKKIIQDEHPDFLLLDLMMPESDGFDVLNYIQKQGIHLPTIILTNLSQKIDRKKCLALGALDYLIKSDIEIPDIIKKILAHL